jgi:hypothetical protein
LDGLPFSIPVGVCEAFKARERSEFDFSRVHHRPVKAAQHGGTQAGWGFYAEGNLYLANGIVTRMVAI